MSFLDLKSQKYVIFKWIRTSRLISKCFIVIVRSGNTYLSNLKAYFQKISAIWG